MLGSLWKGLLARLRNPKVSRDPVVSPASLRGFEGRWVAVKDGEVVAAAETMDQLIMALRDSQRGPEVRNATILRVPGEHEAELVGLG